MAKNTYIDLFAGCGGLSLGLHNAGWKGLFAIEKNLDAFKTLRYNLIDKKSHFDWPSWLPKQNLDIDTVLGTYKEQLTLLRGTVDLVAGGPPCQGFSTAGRRKEDDIRNGLIKSYLRFIMLVRPKLILFENVKGFTLKFEKNKSKGLAYSAYVVRVLQFFGYDVEGKMVDFSEFGIPQKRTRFILVGVRRDVLGMSSDISELFFDELKANRTAFLKERKLPQKAKLRHAISDLFKSNGVSPTLDRKGFDSGIYSKATSSLQKYLRRGCKETIANSHSFPKHKEEIIARFETLLRSSVGNKNISKLTREKFQISKHTIIPLDGNKATPTITTLPDDYIHYCEPRILTVREYARIQTFPDLYEFQGKYTTGGKMRTKEVPRYTQIGNAIPPLFGEQCGIVLKKLLNA